MMALTATRRGFDINLKVKIDDNDEACYGQSRWPALGCLAEEVEQGDTLLHIAVRRKVSMEFMAALFKAGNEIERESLDYKSTNVVAATAADVDPTAAGTYRVAIKAAKKSQRRGIVVAASS